MLPEARFQPCECQKSRDRGEGALYGARNPKEAEAPLGCSPLHLRPFDLRVRHSASGMFGYEPELTAIPLVRRPKPVRAGLSPRPPLGGSSRRIRCRTLTGFYPGRLRSPFGVRIGLPLCDKHTLAPPHTPRKPERSLVFANHE